MSKSYSAKTPQPCIHCKTTKCLLYDNVSVFTCFSVMILMLLMTCRML